MTRQHGYRVERQWLAQVLEPRGWKPATVAELGDDWGWCWWPSAVGPAQEHLLGDDAVEVTRIAPDADPVGEDAFTRVRLVGTPQDGGVHVAHEALLADIAAIETYRITDPPMTFARRAG